MSEAINGYYNSNRSHLLVETLKKFEQGVRPWENNIPPWYSTASKMRCLGKWIIAIAVILAALTISLSILNRGTPLIIYATTGSVATAGSATLSIILLVKSYWPDPAYRQEVREEILQMLISEGYDAAKMSYGHLWHQYSLVTTKEIRHVIDSHFCGKKNYKEMQQDQRNNLHQLIQDGIYPANFFSGQLQLETQKMNLFDILGKYGWQPIADKVLPIDSRFATEAEERLNAIGFQAMTKQYGWRLFTFGILNKDSAVVKKSVGEYLKTTLFTAIDYNQMLAFSLVPNSLLQKMTQLHAQHEEAKNLYERQINAASASYHAALEAIHNQKMAQLGNQSRHHHYHPFLGSDYTREAAARAQEQALAASKASLQSAKQLINSAWQEHIKHST